MFWEGGMSDVPLDGFSGQSRRRQAGRIIVWSRLARIAEFSLLVIEAAEG